MQIAHPLEPDMEKPGQYGIDDGRKVDRKQKKVFRPTLNEALP